MFTIIKKREKAPTQNEILSANRRILLYYSGVKYWFLFLGMFKNAIYVSFGAVDGKNKAYLSKNNKYEHN